jgi:hypothetical protein
VRLLSSICSACPAHLILLDLISRIIFGYWIYGMNYVYIYIYIYVHWLYGARGGVVVKALRYKPAGRGFDSRWCHLKFFSDIILTVALWPSGRLILDQKWVPGVFPGGKGGRCVRLTTLPPSCAVVMKSGSLNFLEPSGPLQACNGTALPLYWLYIYVLLILWVHFFFSICIGS